MTTPSSGFPSFARAVPIRLEATALRCPRSACGTSPGAAAPDRTQRGIAVTKDAALGSPVFSGDTNALALFGKKTDFSALVSQRPRAAIASSDPESLVVFIFASRHNSAGPE